MTQFRLAKMSFYLILLWFVSWTPIATLAMVNSVRDCHHASVIAVFLAHTMTKLGPTFDVFIYGISHPKIKSKFRVIVKWLFTFGKLAKLGSSSMSAEHGNSALHGLSSHQHLHQHHHHHNNHQRAGSFRSKQQDGASCSQLTPTTTSTSQSAAQVQRSALHARSLPAFYEMVQSSLKRYVAA